MVSLDTSYDYDIISSNEYPIAMNSNDTDAHSGVIVLMKTLIGDTIGVIEEPKSNKTTDIIDLKIVQFSFCTIYTTIFILGVFGNVLVCYVVFRNKAMQTVTNVFITNLALSDILLCIFAVPLTPMYTFLGKWVFGRLLCHLMPYAQGTSIYISTLTLTSIAIDRFLVTIYPFHSRMKLKRCISVIVFIWIFSLIVTFPYGFFMGIQITKSKIYYCEESWPSDKSRRIFGVFTTVLQFVIPFLVIALCYTCVSIRLNDRARLKLRGKSAMREEADRERKRRTNRMLISMVAIFGISWLPLNLINIFNDFYAQMTEWNYYYISFFLAHSMAMASTCYNPFLYAWLNENFRKEFKMVLPFFGTTTPVRNSNHSGRLGKPRAIRCIIDSDIIQGNCPDSSNARPSIKQQTFDEVEIENILLEEELLTKEENLNLHITNEESQI